MKNLKIAAIALLATASITAQDIENDKVPTSLNSSFQKAYPNASDIEWEKDGVNFKVEFDQDNMENEIWYSNTGEILKTEKEVTLEDLPSAVISTIKNKYPKYDIDEVELIEAKGNKTYEVELEKWFSEDVKLLIAEDGSIL